MPDVNDILNHSAENRQGYSAWVVTPSGVSILSTIDSIAEVITSVAENRQGYSAWIQTPSGINVPSIDEQIVGVPETEETVTCVGTNIPAIEEQIIGVEEPEPVPVTPGTGGGTYAPVFADVFVEIEETLTSVARSQLQFEELTTVEELITATAVNAPTLTARYGKTEYFVYPTIPDIELPPRVTIKASKFPDEMSSGMLAEKRKKMQQQLLLLDLL